VEIDAVDAVLDRLADRPPRRVRVRFRLARVESGYLPPDPPRRRQQEVPGPAGRIADPQRQQVRPLLGDSTSPRYRLRDHRVERALDQLPYQPGVRVVGAGRLPLAAGAETEGPPLRRSLQPRLQFEQTLVDAPQLLDVHVAVVDAADESGPRILRV